METSFADLDDFDNAENTDPAHEAKLAAELAADVHAKSKRKRSKITPTRRTLQYMRKDLKCELVQITEHWNPFAGVKNDLFGVIDVLGIRGTEIIAVQATSTSNVSSRVAKLVEATFKNPETKTECLVIDALIRAGIKVYVHGWGRDAKGKWVLREVELS
jgi:hypothetical protein